MEKIWNEFCKLDLFFLNDSLENSLIYPKTKSASHCPTELFPIYPNNHWTIRWRDNHIFVPSSNRIKLKIDWFLEAPNHCSAQPQLGKRICINYKKYHWKISFMNDCFHFYMDIPKHWRTFIWILYKIHYNLYTVRVCLCSIIWL